MGSFLLRYWFLVGLAGVVLLGFLVPDGAAGTGVFSPEWLSKAAVAAIFFIRGLLLPLNEILRGVSAWRLHVATQLFLFGVTPVVTFLLLLLAGILIPLAPGIRLGFFFLAVLPTTISTAVVFTSQARGNTAGAVFNATGSNLLGVVVVPLWIGWFLAVEAEAFPVGPVILQVGVLLAGPLVLGQCARIWFAAAAHRCQKLLEIASNLFLLGIVYFVFAESVSEGIWSERSGWEMGAVFFACAAMYALFQAGAAGVGKVLRFNRGDFICHFFCAPQKTLAAGAPMASVLFVGNPDLPVILLPILFYHFIQLMVGGVLVERLRRESPVSGSC